MIVGVVSLEISEAVKNGSARDRADGCMGARANYDSSTLQGYDPISRPATFLPGVAPRESGLGRDVCGRGAMTLAPCESSWVGFGEIGADAF